MMALSIDWKARVKRQIGDFMLVAFVNAIAVNIFELKSVNQYNFVKEEAFLPASTTNITAFLPVNWNATAIDAVRAGILSVFDSIVIADVIK